ncbi:MAG: aminodeoxychorismate lyase [Flavobacteriaceae bacterium]|nr:aminodeoxychorismate lyase [Flavobacteriaceae bacterium]
MSKKIFFTTILVFGFGFGLFSFFYVQKIFFWDNTKFNQKSATIYIKQSDSFSDLKVKLNPYLKNTQYFVLAAKKKGYNERVRSGKYIINKGMGNNEIINTLRSKSLTVNVTFNNQEIIENLAKRISDQIEPDSIQLIKSFFNSSFLKSNNLNKENLISIFIPNSYNFYWNSSADEFRNRMLSESNKFWNQSRKRKAEKLKLTPKEVITLASIVHKETNIKDELPIIAGVYLNRLAKNMKLQADPTVLFSIKKTSGNFDTLIRRLYYKDLKLNSPCNTYLNKGLPPGPISMPDISSIDAVLNYNNDHNFLFFVVDPHSNGRHKFSKSLREHNKKKKIYTDWLRANKIYR